MSMLDHHIYKAVEQGNCIYFNHYIARMDTLRVDEGIIREHMKRSMKANFGDFIVRNKVAMSERREPITGDTIVQAEVFCFTRLQLEDFLKSILNYPEYPEVTRGDHLGLLNK